ncbi:alkaline phosphatase isozyme conversion aminopeptidase [Yersinia frederiksenii]|uniref:Alkaline phosphatase isozyme conversion aminopeptidase n=2 Tax=Yersinia frederiksenii TaxID=29484 RepID=A0A380PYC1_YERFR|nr:aminopeptidase [Yersinia frederiksenii]ATM97111.1 aminopeptidase [Yersinia frederiksenii]EEQ16810.1 Alkaline phosphatase isozyme conversion protein [Yersinia frederiksenii ATCC 33641]KGA45096.1 peptidase M20/M25/M40 family protein [Yersinia frederiksenii ATCC 33641]CNE77254.1 alkaline phosphatase isozyme conversion aminopeptidase [Yersinia frederiksenii]SUP78501.1 alkaline phosphatase isozyme conversion aminopeptidase [Yersinia frederiksenii]
MFSRRCLKWALFTLSFSTVLPLQAATTPATGQIAEQQIRHISTYFPGRMTGSPAELLAAEYINHRFQQMGYQSNLRGFNTRYLYTSKNGKQSWRNVSATSVIAARNASIEKPDAQKQIIIMAHFDTYTPQSDQDLDKNLGGLTLQGVDDNAAGVGVMLELAERLKAAPLRYDLRFVALSAEEIGAQGTENYLKRMSQAEKANTLLVINLDSLITGERLYFNASNQPAAIAVRDQALALARRYGITASTVKNQATSLCQAEKNVFDTAGIPLLSVEASNTKLSNKESRGNNDGCQQRAISKHFPQGITRHQSQLDNLNYLDKFLPGRITKRSHDSVKVLLPLIQELAVAKQ